MPKKRKILPIEERPARDKKYRKAWRNTPKGKEAKVRGQRRYVLKKNFGITVDAYEALLQTQHGKCRICGRAKEENGNRMLAVDHDHITNAIRGLLCTRCNILLGYSGDSPELLIKASRYLLGLL